VGKHLLKLKASFKDKLADGKSIRGSGRLTEEKIKQLQKYYGLVIRQNNY
jgi:ribosomal protein L19